MIRPESEGMRASFQYVYHRRGHMVGIRYGILLVLLGLVLGSCSKREAEILRLTSQLPQGTVRGDTVLMFKFSRAIAAADSTNAWTNTPFVEFTPPVAGKFV